MGNITEFDSLTNSDPQQYVNGENQEPSQLRAERLAPFGKTPDRLMRSVDLLIKSCHLGTIEVIGKENLNALPEGQKVVVACTHISDIDVPVALQVLGNDLRLKLSDQSVHHNFKEEPSMNISMNIAGKDNFFPIDYGGKGAEKHSAAFNPDNFVPMMNAMDEGVSIIMAGHSPSADGHLEKGGYGAAYLAEMADAIVLPISVDVMTKHPNGYDNISMIKHFFKTLVKKSDVSVRIGEPFHLEKIEGIEKIKLMMDKRKSGIRLDQEEYSEFTRLLGEIREQSKVIIGKLAGITPAEKRGD